MKLSTVYDCSIVEMQKNQNRAGNITIVESNTSIPFAIKRVYYLYDVPADEERGASVAGRSNDCIGTGCTCCGEG